MNKKNYLDLLKYYLKSLPDNIIQDIISEYDLHFNEGIRDGKTEEQISEELGSPDIIASEYLKIETKARPKKRYDDYAQSKGVSDDSETNIWKWIVIIGVLILISPFLIGIIASLVGILFGFIGASIGLIVGGIVIFLALIFGFNSFGLSTTNLSIFSQIILALLLIAIGLLFIALFVKFIQWLIKIIKDAYISIKWEMEKR